MNHLTVVVIFLLACSSVYANETNPHTSPSINPPVPHKLVLPTNPDGSVTLTKEQIDYIMWILNIQRKAIEDSQNTSVAVFRRYKELESCVRAAIEKNLNVEKCLNDAEGLWKAEAQK